MVPQFEKEEVDLAMLLRLDKDDIKDICKDIKISRGATQLVLDAVKMEKETSTIHQQVIHPGSVSNQSVNITQQGFGSQTILTQPGSLTATFMTDPISSTLQDEIQYQEDIGHHRNDWDYTNESIVDMPCNCETTRHICSLCKHKMCNSSG